MVVVGRISVLTAAVVSLSSCQSESASTEIQLTSEGLEHVAAINAHHLCAGLWVVGRDIDRDVEVVIARDIAPFAAFRWDSTIEYRIDPERQLALVRVSGAPERSAGYYGDQGCVIHVKIRAPWLSCTRARS
jgi:hypothetical protein